jgi:hypothetical protein
MRLRIRTLLLAVALVCGLSSTASACCFIPLLDPFHWLLGCNCGYGGHGGLHGNPHATHRFIDDWLGYGYLRNQQGTLGHYPGRPFQCYQPLFPRLFAPCAPCAPALAMPGPMVAPLAPPIMPGPMYNPCYDPCEMPCEDPCQSMPVPVTTWRPMTVDRGHWARVWVPRPITTMVPQTQYMQGVPIMNSGWGDDCCADDCCGAGNEGYDSMMPGMNLPGATSEPGCCGSEGDAWQSAPANAVPATPETTMWTPTQNAWAPQYAMNPYSSMGRAYPAANAWSPTAGYPSFANAGYPAHPGANRRFGRRDFRTGGLGFARSGMRPLTSPFAYRGSIQPNSAQMAYNPALYPSQARVQPWYAQQAYTQQAYTQQAYTQQAYTQQAYTQQAYAQQAYAQQPHPLPWQMAPAMGQPMPPHYGTAPNGMMQDTVMLNQSLAGDIMGDHELNATSSAGLQVVPNGFSGSVPIVPANWSNPRPQFARRYDNSVR